MAILKVDEIENEIKMSKLKRQMKNAERTNITFLIPVSLHHRFKRRVTDESTNMTDVLIGMIKNYLGKRD